jgi:sialidase-1
MKKVFYLLLFFTLHFELQAQKNSNTEVETTLNFQTLFTANMQEDVACYRIPAIITAPNGNLIAAIDERVPSCDDLRTNDNIDIVIRRSADNGATWSVKETIVDYRLGESASDPSMIVDAVTGEIFLFYNYMNLEQEKDVYYLKLIKSNDNGKTWVSRLISPRKLRKRHGTMILNSSLRGGAYKPVLENFCTHW